MGQSGKGDELQGNTENAFSVGYKKYDIHMLCSCTAHNEVDSEN